jgi:tetratricopeptide (TPR) repeat protein
MANNEQKALILIGKGRALDSLAQHSPQSDPIRKEALKCFEKAEKITGLDMEYIALLNFNKGYTYGNWGGRWYKEAEKFLKKAIEGYEQLRSMKGNKKKFNTEYADALRNLAFVRAVKSLDKIDKQKALEAIDEDFEKAEKADESFSLIYNTRGYVYEMFGRYEDAKKWYGRAVEKDPYLAIAWYNKGYLTFESESSKNHNNEVDKTAKYQEAIEDIDNAIKIDPNISYEWYYKGYVLYRGLKKYSEAIKCFDKALEIDPNFSYAWYNKGLVLLELEKSKEALECIEGAIKCLNNENDERIAFMLFNKAIALDSLGEEDEALKCFEKAIEKLDQRNKPNQETKDDVGLWIAFSYHGMGMAYGNKERYPDAIKCFEKSIDYYPERYETERANTMRNLGFVYAKQENHEKAKEYFDKSLEIAPNFGYAWNSRGFYFLEHHDKYDDKKMKLKEASDDFDKAIQCFEKNDPHIYYPYYFKGRVLYQLDCFEKAIEFFNEALRIKSDDVDARYGIGLSNYFIGIQDRKKSKSGVELRKFEDAIKYFDEAIRINPSFTGWYYKALVLYSRKRYSEAVECFDEATELYGSFNSEFHPNYIDAWYYKALALYSIKRYEEAIECFDVIHDMSISNQKVDKEMTISSLCYKGNANYWLAKKGDIANNYDKDQIKKIYQTAIDCHTAALDLLKNIDPKIGGVNRFGVSTFDILFDRGVFKFHKEDFSGARIDFEEALRVCDDKSRIGNVYNNIGICYFQTGKQYYKEAEASFKEAIKNNSNLGDAYYNIATLHWKENKWNQARSDLESYRGQKHPDIEKSKAELKDRTEPDWYDWWFSQSRTKRTMGLMLIAVILVPFIGTGIVIYQGYQEGFTTITEIFSENAEILIGGFIIMIGIVVGILLLPSLRKLKVGNAIELERDSPRRFIESSESSFRPKFQFIENVHPPSLPNLNIPIERPEGKNIMPLKFQRQLVFVPYALGNMPTRMSFSREMKDIMQSSLLRKAISVA